MRGEADERPPFRLELRRGYLAVAVLAALRTEQYGYTLRKLLSEQGLAVDFTCNGGGALSSSSSCFTWLKANAADYGFYNLPSEPWHWSVDGS